MSYEVTRGLCIESERGMNGGLRQFLIDLYPWASLKFR